MNCYDKNISPLDLIFKCPGNCKSEYDCYKPRHYANIQKHLGKLSKEEFSKYFPIPKNYEDPQERE